MKVKGILVFILMASLVVFSVGPAAGQSVYLSADHHTQQFDAWNINPDGTIVYQATCSLSYATDPAGIAIDAVTGENDPLMFVTTEGIGGIEVINPVTLQFHGVAPGPVNMGGVDVDDIDNIIFAIQRGTSEYGGWGTSELYIYSYNDDGSGITQQANITLPNHGAGFSLAFDDLRDILWVGDYADHMVRAYDVNVPTWSDIVEIPTLSFSVSHQPIDVAVDSRRNLVYTVAGWAGSPLLTKYDVATGTETAIDLGEGGIGIAVEEIRGYVYITRGPEQYSEYPDGDDIQVWDCSTSPFTLLQDTDSIGNPAGIAIGNVGFDPYNLAKNDAIQGYGVYIGQTFTYDIYFDNYRDSLHDMTGVTVVDDLPVELDFVSETVGGVPGTGMYDPVTHTVTWYIGTIPAGQAGPLIELVVRVNQNASPDSTIYNWATIDSDQWPPHTEPGYDPDNPEPDDPGTPVLPNILVDIDIKPQSCPNPFNTKAKGVLPVAVLGTEDFDATTVDPATVLLEGVAPLRWNFEDVSTPVESGADTCECTTEGPDGYMDMTLKFDHREILAALGTVQDGEMRVLTLTGMTYDSIPIMGQDCVVIIHKEAAKLSAETPTEFSLSSNYPNPFNPETNISFTLPERTQVTLIIYNILGERVKTLVNRDMEAGIHTIHWDGADGSGNSIASGIYFYKLSAGDFTATKKMVLTK